MTTTINNEHKKLNVPNSTDRGNVIRNVPALRFPEFSGEWKREILNDVCTFHNGRAYKQNELLSDGKYRVLRVGNFFTNDSWYYSDLELDDEKVAVNGDLLYAWSASFGPRFWTGEKVIYHYHIWKIDSFQQVSKEFLFYFLERDTEKIKNEVQGGTMVHITKGDMEKREILYPSILEQSKIARLLSLLDERIATQNKIIEDLKKLKSAISERLFKSVKGSIVLLSNICDIVKGKQINGENLSERGRYYVMNGGTEPSGYYDDYNVEANTISISEGGNSCGYVQFNTFPFWSGGHCYSIQNVTGNVDNLYLYHYLKSKEDAIMKLRIGSGLPNIQKKDLAIFKIKLPTFEQQKIISIFLSSLERKAQIEADILIAMQSEKQHLLRQMFI